MSAPPTELVTFLLTDIQGSTWQWERFPDAMGSAVRRHDAILSAAIAAHHGSVIKARLAGDSFFATFERPSNAVAAALAIQQALHAEAWPKPVAIRVRMGLHTGEAELREGDFYGDAVNRAARLRDAGHGGQVLLSGVTAGLVAGHLPPDANLRPLGTRRLKDLQRPEEIVQLVHPELPVDFPPLATADVVVNNIPIQLTSFVGRASEVPELRRLLGTERLVTLVGPGGTGKTRLALEVASACLTDFDAGVWVVELADLWAPAEVARRVASTLAVREEPGRDITDTLSAYLGRGERLLVLDNCEQMVDAIAELVERLLRTCPGLKVLCTSREDLRVAGEYVYTVPPLGLPAARAALDPRALMAADAVRLFVERAESAYHPFRLSPANAPALVDLCTRLEGAPLAIELMAAMVGTLSVEQLARRMADRLDLSLRSRHRGPRRHQTLEQAIAWSYDLLPAVEQQALGRLAVFHGGFDLEAAEAVVADATVPAGSVHGALAELVRKSLVAADATAEVARFRLLETIRTFALAKLSTDSDTRAAIRDRHARFYAHLAEAAAPGLKGPDQLTWLERLDRERDNLQAAALAQLEIGDVSAAYRLTAALWRYWYLRGQAGTGLALIEEALQAGSPRDQSAQRADALHGAGTLANLRGDAVRAREHLEAALVIRRELDDRAGIAGELSNLALVANDLGDSGLARSYLEESLRIYQQGGDRWHVAVTLGNLATVAHVQSDFSAAQELGTAALAAQRELGDEHAEAAVLLTLGATLLALGKVAAAMDCLAESLAIQQRLGDPHRVAEVRRWLGIASHQAGDLATARRCYEESLAAARELQAELEMGEDLRLLGDLALDEGLPDQAARLYEEGLALADAASHGEVRVALRSGLARVALARGHVDEARRLARSNLAEWRALGMRLKTTEELENLALVEVAAGEAARALRLLGAAWTERADMGTPASTHRATHLADARRSTEAALGAHAAAEWDTGCHAATAGLAPELTEYPPELGTEPIAS